MKRKTVREFLISAGEGCALELQKGQVLRIYQVEGKQVGACAFFNAHNYEEVFSLGKTWPLNNYRGTLVERGGWKHLFSKPPRENVMLTVLEDTVKDHGWSMGGRCSKRLYTLKYNEPEHRSCQENLTEALKPYDLDGSSINDVFNVFMKGIIDPEGYYRIQSPAAQKGDYIDLLAEMDLLVAISACPNDKDPTNDYLPKPLGVNIFE